MTPKAQAKAERLAKKRGSEPPPLDTWLAHSRHKSTGFVIDLRWPSVDRLAEAFNDDARRMLALAQSTGYRYLVVAGQLHRPEAGAWGAMVPEGDVDMLCIAAGAGHEALSDKGETLSHWMILCTEPETEARVKSALAAVSATEGSA